MIVININKSIKRVFISVTFTRLKMAIISVKKARKVVTIDKVAKRLLSYQIENTFESE